MSDQKYTVLYVDDEPSNLRIFRLSFKRNYNVLIAENGKDAIQMLKNEHVDLIITDQKMPEMTGTELLENTLEEFPDLIRIILTGFSDIQSIVNAVNKIGIYRYITKPYDQGELKLTLDKALESNKLKLERVNLLKELEQKNQELEQKVKERTYKLESLNDRMVESLEYGSLVQQSLLPSAKQLSSSFKEHFVIFMPFDHVSGDFYWFTEFEKDNKQYKIIALMDCMGHGVAGALQSSMGISYLWQIVEKYKLISAGQILHELDIALSGEKTGNENTHNSMDGAVVVFNETDKMISFAGAKCDLAYIEGDQVNVVKSSRESIGSSWGESDKQFEEHSIELKGIESIYLFTDGYTDQMNSDFSKKFGKKQLLKLIEEIRNEPLERQKKVLAQKLLNWKGESEQIDDISMIGIKF